jgi:hypothetical protein
MCDYSLEHLASRPAKVGDRLISTTFPNSVTRGFTAAEEPNVAVCLLPGTELAFASQVEWEGRLGFFSRRTLSETVARFRHINESEPRTHHDALEFANGTTVLVTQLRSGQHATVLQLPAEAHPAEVRTEEPAVTETREPVAV